MDQFAIMLLLKVHFIISRFI